MKFNDNFFQKVENKTNVNKDTIMSLAKKLQGEGLKNEGKLRELIKEIGVITGKDVPKVRINQLLDQMKWV